MGIFVSLIIIFILCVVAAILFFKDYKEEWTILSMTMATMVFVLIIVCVFYLWDNTVLSNHYTLMATYEYLWTHPEEVDRIIEFNSNIWMAQTHNSWWFRDLLVDDYYINFRGIPLYVESNP